MSDNIRGKIRGIRKIRRKIVLKNQNFETKAVESPHADPRLVKLGTIPGMF